MTTGASGEAEETTVDDSTGGEEANPQESGDEAAQSVPEGTEGQAETDDEFGVGKEGDIPRERWDAAYGKFKERGTELEDTAKERDQLKGLFESIQSDPNARQKFVDSMKGEQEGAKEAPKEQPVELSWKKFIDEDPSFKAEPGSQTLMTGLVGALGDDFQGHLDRNYVSKAEIEQMLAPIKRYVGDAEINGFFEKNPTAKQYETQLVDIMKRLPGASLQDALAIAEKTPNKVRASGERRVGQNQDKLRKTPINKTGSGGQTRKPLPKGDAGIEEAVKQTFAELGIND